MGTKAVDVDMETVAGDSLRTGSQTVTTTAGGGQLTTITYAKKGIRVKAHADNPAVVYVGKAGVTIGPGGGATDGYPLAAGEQIDLPIQNPSTIYLIAPVGACVASFILI